ncbi:MAG TPA: hypothetical protein GXX29_12410 [Firmicutes bacterium]|nr:hypothetical protein [Bacillota bacterium]
MNFREFVEYCADQGVDGVEFANDDIRQLSDGDVRELLAKHRLAPASYVIKTDFVHKDPAKFDAALTAMYEELHRAHGSGQA